MIEQASTLVRSLRLTGDGLIPNNPNCPVLLYSNVVDSNEHDPATAFELLFAANGWPPAWRNGILQWHHFHSNAHEVLGIYSGMAVVQLGGENGPEVELSFGDVVLIPAGVAHRKLSCDGNFGVVAAYPAGQLADMCEPDSARYWANCDNVRQVTSPICDPVSGPSGPLGTRWTKHQHGASTA